MKRPWSRLETDSTWSEPKKLGGIANHQQEPWKSLLSEFIDELYEKRLKSKKKSRVVLPIEGKAKNDKDLFKKYAFEEEFISDCTGDTLFS